MNIQGTYTTISGLDAWRYNLTSPIEGTREGWAERLFAVAPKDGQERQGFMLALYALRNSFLPPAYERALPIARFERAINKVIADLEEYDRSRELALKAERFYIVTAGHGTLQAEGWGKIVNGTVKAIKSPYTAHDQAFQLLAQGKSPSEVEGEVQDSVNADDFRIHISEVTADEFAAVEQWLDECN